MKLRLIIMTLTLSMVMTLMVVAPGCSDENNGQNPNGNGPAAWTRQMMVQACVMMHSCGVMRLTTVNDCIYAFELKDIIPNGLGPLHKTLHQCISLAKGSCDAVRACYGAEKQDPPCKTTPVGGYQSGCDGDVKRFCEGSDKRIYRIDCSKGGLKCALDANGQPFCSAGPCKSPTDNSCLANGTQAVHCNGQGLQVEQCDWLGLVCGKDSTNKYDCIGTGKECKG